MTLKAHNILRVAIAAALIASSSLAASVQTAPSSTVAKAKELSEVMKAKKLTSFAMKEDPAVNRFAAVLFVPDVQLLVVSAIYSQATDIEYYLGNKEYAMAYRNLRAGALATELFFVEDMMGDGLAAVPAKNALPDTAVVGTTEFSFAGPGDPKKRNDKRMAPEAYAKAFGDVEQRYAKILDAMLAELKKAEPLVPAGVLR